MVRLNHKNRRLTRPCENGCQCFLNSWGHEFYLLSEAFLTQTAPVKKMDLFRKATHIRGDAAIALENKRRMGTKNVGGNLSFLKTSIIFDLRKSARPQSLLCQRLLLEDLIY